MVDAVLNARCGGQCGGLAEIVREEREGVGCSELIEGPVVPHHAAPAPVFREQCKIFAVYLTLPPLPPNRMGVEQPLLDQKDTRNESSQRVTEITRPDRLDRFHLNWLFAAVRHRSSRP
jgi:hypothetical protein